MSANHQAADAVRGNRFGQGWCMPRLVQDFGLELLAQQLWCWGRDIVRPDGNLLMQFGFERHRYRGKSEMSTCYRLDDGIQHVCLWGFGMFFGRRDHGGLFAGRLDFCPTWAPIESLSAAIHRLSDLPDFARPRGRSQWQRARRLWKSLLQWIAGYERWVRSTAGVVYRRECVASWLWPFVRAEQMAAAWQYLSHRKWEQEDQSVSKALRQFVLSEPAE